MTETEEQTLNNSVNDIMAAINESEADLSMILSVLKRANANLVQSIKTEEPEYGAQ